MSPGEKEIPFFTRELSLLKIEKQKEKGLL
jgi:hypothetical protein